MSELTESQRRLNAYYTLCSHYRRWLAHSVRENLEEVLKVSDEHISRLTPKYWRVMAEELIKQADRADRECMAVWHVPIDRLDDFVMVRSHPELERMMLEQAGMVWDDRYLNWVERDEL